MKHKIEYIPIDSIKINPKNSRIHPPDQIKLLVKSIDRYGFNVPILIDKDNLILSGHGRLEAAIALGMKVVPVIQIPLAGRKAREYVIADNSIAELSKWDLNFLKTELKELSLELDISDLGFSEAFLNEFGKTPKDFKDINPDSMELKHVCPKCKYEWN